MFHDFVTLAKWIIGAYVILQIAPWFILAVILIYDYLIQQIKNLLN